MTSTLGRVPLRSFTCRAARKMAAPAQCAPQDRAEEARADRAEPQRVTPVDPPGLARGHGARRSAGWWSVVLRRPVAELVT